MTPIEVGAVATAVAGILGALYAALRFQREDAGAVVTQQAQVLAAMRGLNEELTKALARCREECAEAVATQEALRHAVKSGENIERLMNDEK